MLMEYHWPMNESFYQHSFCRRASFTYKNFLGGRGSFMWVRILFMCGLAVPSSTTPMICASVRIIMSVQVCVYT